MIADALSGAVIGQDPTLAALATAVHAQLTLHQPGRPTGVLLLAGPDVARAKDAIAHALADVLGYDWGLYDLADPDLTVEQLFRSGPSGPRPGSLSHQLMRVPHSVIVLDGIERADPPVLERLIASWRNGVILDIAGRGSRPMRRSSCSRLPSRPRGLARSAGRTCRPINGTSPASRSCPMKGCRRVFCAALMSPSAFRA
jgi:hypothetical protein